MEYILRANTFAALRAPIYYYVKTKGSLVTQAGSLSDIFAVKLRVFEYYNNFFKNVLDERSYEKKRFAVYRYLLDTAGDGIVLPSTILGTKKLGDERGAVYQEAIRQDGPLYDIYRNEKLLARYLEPIALENNMTEPEIRLLTYICHLKGPVDRKTLSDFSGVGRGALSPALKKLSAEGFIKFTDQRQSKSSGDKKPNIQSKRLLYINVLPAARPIVAEIRAALEDYEASRLYGLSDEELAQYYALSGKIRENIIRILK